MNPFCPVLLNFIMSYNNTALGVPFDDPDDRSISNLFSANFLAKHTTPISLLSKQVHFKSIQVVLRTVIKYTSFSKFVSFTTK